MKDISVIIPTKNSECYIDKCLNSIASQNFSKEALEIIVVDGNSSDNTLAIAQRYGCKIITESIGNQAGAYNAGIKQAEGKFIVFTDSDCYVAGGWLNSLTAHLSDGRTAAVGGPNLTPDDDQEIGKSAGVVLHFLSKAGARYGMVANDVVETFHNPTCNVAYKRDVLLEIGGFNDRLVTCADEELDFRIKEKGYRLLYTPEAKVFHYRRTSYMKFANQAYKYAVGRAQSIRLHRKMGKWFHYAPSIGITLMVALLGLSFFNAFFAWIAAITITSALASLSILAIYHSIKTKTNAFHCLVLTFAWLFTYGLGFFRGLLSKRKMIPK